MFSLFLSLSMVGQSPQYPVASPQYAVNTAPPCAGQAYAQAPVCGKAKMKAKFFSGARGGGCHHRQTKSKFKNSTTYSSAPCSTCR